MFNIEKTKGWEKISKITRLFIRFVRFNANHNSEVSQQIVANLTPASKPHDIEQSIGNGTIKKSHMRCH